MNNVSKSSGLVKRVGMLLCITTGLGVIAFQGAADEDKRLSTATSPLSRFLLVAREGLYVVEPDGRCSWSYHPAPSGQQVRAMEDDIIYDGWALPNDHYQQREAIIHAIC